MSFKPRTATARLLFRQTPEFARELRRFARAGQPLGRDLARAKRQIAALAGMRPGVKGQPYRESFFATGRALLLLAGGCCEVAKLRLDQADGAAPVVLVYWRQGREVLLLELYTQGEGRREDAARIRQYCWKGYGLPRAAFANSRQIRVAVAA